MSKLSLTAALVALARHNIPTDVQDLLVSGDPMRSIAPGALATALEAPPTDGDDEKPRYSTRRLKHEIARAVERGMPSERIQEVIKEEGQNGAACGWRSCTGCHETNEGAETGYYPYSKAFGCYVGAGCGECGGLGVVWEHWSKEDLAAMMKDDTGSAIDELKTRDDFERAVVDRMAESGFLEIEVRTEVLVRCDEGYCDEVINAGWHYWKAGRAAIVGNGR